MELTGVSAIGAASATSGRSTAPPVNGTGAVSGPTFDQVLGNLFNEGVQVMQAGEAAAIQGMTGGLPAFKVVDAVMSAQRTLTEGIAIRDKAVSAYQEIARMAI